MPGDSDSDSVTVAVECYLFFVECDRCQVTAVLKGKGDQSEEIARFARLYAIYFYLNPLVH